MPDNNTNETPVKPQSDGSKFCGYMEYICSKLDEIAEGAREAAARWSDYASIIQAIPT